MKTREKVLLGLGGTALGIGVGALIHYKSKPKKQPPVVGGGITLTDLIIAPTTVSPNQDVTISATATNESASALSDTVQLTADGLTGRQTVDLDPGKSTTVTFTVTPLAAGSYSVTLKTSSSSLSGSFICTSLPYGDIVLSNLVITPITCNEGDTVTISCTAKNNGAANEVMAVTLHLLMEKYNSSSQATKQIILEPGASTAVIFTYQPAVDGKFTVTVDSLSGSFSVNPPKSWPGWTDGIVVWDITVTPTQLYVGETAQIIVDVQGPPSPPAKYPMNIEATISVDGTKLAKTFTIDFSNPGLYFTYTPTKVGDYTVTAQDKTATFHVLANPTGTYYSPFGGTRMPLCTDIVFPNVAAFTAPTWGGMAPFIWPGGDLKWSQLCGKVPQLPWWPVFSIFIFGMGTVSLNIPQLNAAIPNAQPCAWEPDGSTITNYAIKYMPATNAPGGQPKIFVMATQYQCQDYWDSKDELAIMIANFVESHGAIKQNVPSDWQTTYGVTCPVCGGTGYTLAYGKHKQKCWICNGTGKVFESDIFSGLRDWSASYLQRWIEGLLYVVDYYSYTYTCKIYCPYCGSQPSPGGWPVILTYSNDPGIQGRLDCARALLEHIETVHPNHPLTSPAS